MRLRRLVLCTLALGLVTSSAAMAAPKKPAPKPAPKPVCLLLTDQSGDGQSKVYPMMNSDALDIISADVVSGAKTFVAVLRLKTTKTDNDNWAMLTGMRWSMAFEVGGTSISFTRYRKAGLTPAYQDAMTVGGGGGASPVTTMNDTTITWTVPRTAIPMLNKAKSSVTNIGAVTYVNSANADDATSKATYPDKYPSCVKAA